MMFSKGLTLSVIKVTTGLFLISQCPSSQKGKVNQAEAVK